MRKLKLALLLPLAQFIISMSIVKWNIILLWYPTGALWFAINCPGLPFLEPFILAAPIRWMPLHIMGILPRDFILLVGAAIVWYFIGGALDSLWLPKEPTQSRLTTGKVLVNLFLIAWGTRLILIGLRYNLPAFARQPHSSDNVISSVIILVWSVLLVFVPGLRLVSAFRHKLSGPPLPNKVP